MGEIILLLAMIVWWVASTLVVFLVLEMLVAEPGTRRLYLREFRTELGDALRRIEKVPIRHAIELDVLPANLVGVVVGGIGHEESLESISLEMLIKDVADIEIGDVAVVSSSNVGAGRSRAEIRSRLRLLKGRIEFVYQQG